MSESISGQLKMPPTPDDPAPMFTVNRINDIGTELTHARDRIRIMRKADPSARHEHGLHFDNHLKTAMDHAGRLKDNMLAHYPAEAEEWRRLAHVMNLSNQVVALASGYTLNKRSDMISLDLLPGTVAPVPGGVDDHHITVIYLGPDVDDEAFAEACRRARAAAAAIPGPLTGSVGGIGTFPPSKGSDAKKVAWTGVVLPGAEQLRSALEDLSASEHKDWKIHVTLAYLDPDEPLPAPVPQTPVTITHLSVHRGGDVVRFPLGGGPTEMSNISGQISVDLAKSVSPAAKAASFAHLLQTIMYDGAHAAQHSTAMLGDTNDRVWNFDADHAEKHTDGALEHCHKLVDHILDNYPAEARLLRSPAGRESNLSAVLDDSITGQILELHNGWMFQPRDEHGHWIKGHIAGYQDVRSAGKIPGMDQGSKHIEDPHTKAEHINQAISRHEQLAEHARALGREDIAQQHAAAAAKLSEGLKAEEPTGTAEPVGESYEELRRKASSYNATSAPKEGSALRTYSDPEKQKEAIRLHTAARRAAPDAKAKKYHTDQINQHKSYLQQIERNQKIGEFDRDSRETQGKLRDLKSGSALATADGQQKAADLENHLADIHEAHGKYLTEHGFSGSNYAEAVTRHRDRAAFHQGQADEVRAKTAAVHARINEQLPGAQAKVAQFEATARSTGKPEDVNRAVQGHKEIVRHARVVGKEDVAQQHEAAAAKLESDAKSLKKPRSSGKPTLASLEAEAKAKETHAVQTKNPDDMRAAAQAYRAAALGSGRQSTKAMHNDRADAIDRAANQRESANRTEAVIADPSSARSLNDEHLTAVNHDLNSRANRYDFMPGAGKNPEAHAAVKNELALRGLPVEQPYDNLKPMDRSEKYPETIPRMTDAQLAEADREHARLTAQAGGGARVIGEGHKAVRAEMQRRADLEAQKPENRRKAYETAANIAPYEKHPTVDSLQTPESLERGAKQHDRAAELAVTERQRQMHQTVAQRYRDTAAAKREYTRRDNIAVSMAGDATNSANIARRFPSAQTHEAAAKDFEAAAEMTPRADWKKGYLASAKMHREEAQHYAGSPGLQLMPSSEIAEKRTGQGGFIHSPGGTHMKALIDAEAERRSNANTINEADARQHAMRTLTSSGHARNLSRAEAKAALKEIQMAQERNPKAGQQPHVLRAVAALEKRIAAVNKP